MLAYKVLKVVWFHIFVLRLVVKLILLKLFSSIGLGDYSSTRRLQLVLHMSSSG